MSTKYGADSQHFQGQDYDADKRRKEIMDALSEYLEESKKRVRKFREELLARPREDVCMSYLKAKKYEADDLDEEIKAFRNPNCHLTKEYRDLQHKSKKLKYEIDGIDVIGRDDLKDLKKTVLEQIGKMTEQLERAAHQNGKRCKECPSPTRD